MRVLGLALAIALLAPGTMAAQSAADSAAIRATAMDYIQGWYDADAPRMERSLHADLAKRIVVSDPGNGKDQVNHLTAATLVRDTGSKTRTDEARQRKDITILDIFQNMASVKLVAGAWVDYMHMGKVDGRWVIVNVMWDEMRIQRGS